VSDQIDAVAMCAPSPLKSGTKEKPIMQIRTLAEAISHYGHQAYLLTVAQDGPTPAM
jgi:hypothetical protein